MNHKFARFWLLAALSGLQVVFMSSCAENEVFNDSGNSKAGAVIVVSEEAHPVEIHAAEELAHFLGRVTGAECIRSPHSREGMMSIWLGTPGVNPAARETGVSGEVDALSDHGFMLKSIDNGLMITGREPLGVLYGAYAFLEEHMGVRWFFPGEDGTYLPASSGLQLGGIYDVQNPGFEERTMAFGSTATDAFMVDSWDWMVRNRMHFDVGKNIYRLYPEEMEKRGAGTQTGGHVLMRHVPDSLFDEHPEYFALVGGERIKQRGPGGRHLSQPCTSHPDVLSRVAGGIVEMLESEPAGGSYRFLNNDADVWCECERCARIAHEDEIGRYGGDVSTRYFDFVNKASREVWDTKPGADIWAYAYQSFRLPPKGTAPDPRLKVVLCDHGRCYRHSLGDDSCPGNSWFKTMYEGWAETGNPLSNFTYYNCFTQPGIIAAPLDRVIADDLRFMHGLGFVNWNFRTMPPDGDYSRIEAAGVNTARQEEHWRANIHNHYIQAKLAWDPSINVDELMKDFNAKFYGPAGAAMGSFREKLVQAWEETDGCYVYQATSTLMRKSVSGREEQMLALLDEAEKAAAGHEKYLARVRKDREIFEDRFLAGDAPGEKVFARRVEGPVTIDGRLDEGAWDEAEPVTGFIRRSEWGVAHELADFQTKVRILYDDDYIYVGLEMEEPEPLNLVMNAEERDSGRIWEDDTVELFFDPDGSGVRYVHFAINPAGVFRDSERVVEIHPSGDPAFDSGAVIAASKGDDSWSVEMKVPAENLGRRIKTGDSWTMDAGRVRKAGARREISSWLDGSFHQPENFRQVVFNGN